jgi:outer membrane protein assembly factor BamB
VAFDAATGVRRWSSCPATRSEARVLGSTEGIAVVVTAAMTATQQAGDLVGVDAETGAERWRTPLEGWPAISEVAPAGLFLAVWSPTAGPTGTLLALDPATGTERWRGPGGAFVSAGDALVRLDAGPLGTALVAVDAATGAERWRVPLDGQGFALALGDGVVATVAYDGDDGSTATGWSLVDGGEVWRAEIGSGVAQAGGVLLLSEGAGTDVSTAGVDLTTGERLWSAPYGFEVPPGSLPGPVPAADGMVYGSVWDGTASRFAAVDLATGAATPVTAMTGSGSVIVADDLLLTWTNQDVQVISLRDDSARWQARALPPEIDQINAYGYVTSAVVAGDVVVAATSNNSGR